MVQIARTALPPNQVFHIALGRVFGIGRATGLEVAEACGISRELRVKDLKEHQVQRVAQYIQQHCTVGDDLRRSIRDNVLALIRMQSYRGQRHQLGLSIGGHTQSNNKTAKILRHHLMYDTSRT